ncbi:hypothetical protein BG006_001576 [Podila minutissima]|uniref:Nickel/cobalt efflux system n=1 Tax=Podila minutissima TaxID=64525 RepID=A0A9P5SA52_9FUNG|nr:hypothetical protein BG006_001576 [Podila minutissima]
MSDPTFSEPKLKRKCLITIGGLVVVNIVVWILAGFIARQYPSLLGAMVVAYTLGLRHAVDTDHLAAIDNVTRKLIYQESLKARAEGMDSFTPPVCVGLFFSLGHSTIVIVASTALALTATAIKDKFDAFGDTGGIIGTSVSAAFLLLIGFINLFVLIQVARELRSIRRSSEYRYHDSLKDLITSTPGIHSLEDNVDGAIKETKNHKEINDDHASDIVEPKDSRFQMYPLGVLFGLGFDTATEVGLLGIAATNAQAGFPTAVILIFPALFTAGMSLIDTLDGIIMIKAYGWAFVNPVKKLYYNFVVTLMGVVVAFVVGIAELLALLAEKLDLEGLFWNFFTVLSDHFGVIGYMILGTFILTWMFAIIFYKYGPIKDFEKKVVVV